MLIYEIDINRIYTGQSREIGFKEGRPSGWIRSEIAPPEGIAQWTGSGWNSLAEYPGPSFEQRKTEMIAAVRAKRWEVENGGVEMIPGVVIQTDVVSQSKVAGGVQLFQNDPTLTHVDFEAQPNQWVTMDAATMTQIGIAVGRHIQACFSNARLLQEAIQAAVDVDDLALIDIESGWP